MAKLLIIDSTFIPTHEETPRFCTPGEFVSVDADVAGRLTSAGRALYVSLDDDPTRGRYTAPTELVEAAIDVAKQATEEPADEPKKGAVKEAKNP